jgi:hypothetical protein
MVDIMAKSNFSVVPSIFYIVVSNVLPTIAVRVLLVISFINLYHLQVGECQSPECACLLGYWLVTGSANS